VKRSATLFVYLCLAGWISLLTPATLPAAEPANPKIAPIRRLPGFTEAKKRAEEERKAKEAEVLQYKLAPQPRFPIVTKGFAGMDFNDTPGFVPPDTHAATGPDHIVETVNTTVAVFNRTTGANLFQQDLSDFFSSVGATTNLSDPVVAYDEQAGRFFIGVINFGPSGNTSNLLYAVSDSSDPTAGFTEMHSINVTELGNSGCPKQTVTADFTRVGWNADAHVFTFNMFNVAGTCFDHVSVITIAKSTALDKDSGTLTFFHADRDDTHFTLAPATMHGSSTGDPMWFVEESIFFNTIRVVKMTNIMSITPTFTDTDITVAAYGFPPSATQQGGGFVIETNDSRILNSEWRSDRLVAAQTVGLSGTARARWYEFDTSSTPSVTQQGAINPGSAIHTYYPSIAIAENGDLGMTFMQSSSAEFMSMYVTGRTEADAAGTVQTPVLAKAGLRNYDAFDCSFFSPCRAGDYSGITVDPNFTNVFCGANEYATSASSDNWGTWIACFSVRVHDLAVTKITAPKTATGPGPVTLPVKVTIQNRSDHNETIPDASALGNGTSSGLVQLSVTRFDDDNETCDPTAGVTLDTTKNAALFSKGPKVLKPKGTATINFLVTYHCSSAQPANKLDLTRGDYSHTANVYHDVIDPGVADSHTADDTCPHNPLFDSNPLPSGMTDKGCGAKKPDGTLGGAVVTDVVL